MPGAFTRARDGIEGFGIFYSDVFRRPGSGRPSSWDNASEIFTESRQGRSDSRHDSRSSHHNSRDQDREPRSHRRIYRPVPEVEEPDDEPAEAEPSHDATPPRHYGRVPRNMRGEEEKYAWFTDSHFGNPSIPNFAGAGYERPWEYEDLLAGGGVPRYYGDQDPFTQYFYNRGRMGQDFGFQYDGYEEPSRSTGRYTRAFGVRGFGETPHEEDVWHIREVQAYLARGGVLGNPWTGQAMHFRF